MAITTLAGLRDATRRDLDVWLTGQIQASIGTASYGYVTSFWTFTKRPGGVGATPPSGGENPTASTTGALPIADASGGAAMYLAEWSLSMARSTAFGGFLVLYDRLAHNSGLVGNSGSSQDFTDISISRGDTTGEGVMCLLEIYSSIGTTTATLSVSYTNQAGTSGRTGTIEYVTSSAAAGGGYLMQLQAGDTGVRSVQSCQWSGSGPGTAGNFGLTLARPVAAQSFAAPDTTEFARTPLDALMLGLPVIDPDACLALLWMRAAQVGSGSVDMTMHFGFVEG